MDSSNTTTTSASSVLSPEKFNFSPDSPSPITLTSDQVKHCTQALNLLNDKLRAPHTITQEFAHLQANRITPSEMRRRCTVAIDSVNLSKNRYTDVLPFDKNRVVLKSSTDYRPEAQGYINASLFSTSSPGNVSQFIATQGPLPHTYEDFWEMIIQYHCPAIIMLTRLVDNYKKLHHLFQIFARYNSAADGAEDVLLDQNFVNDMNSSPLYVSHKAKRVLQRAVWTDTSFLNSINVMDYSLLVGVDYQKRELVCGIIDYLRQYTWDKHLETWMKSSLVVPKNVLPTVISPIEYKKRFRKVMSKYFLSVPDHWCSQKSSNPCNICCSGEGDDSSQQKP